MFKLHGYEFDNMEQLLDYFIWWDIKYRPLEGVTEPAILEEFNELKKFFRFHPEWVQGIMHAQERIVGKHVVTVPCKMS